MILNLEIKKLKRTGYFPTFLAAGLLATAFPLINMIVRPETFTSLAGDPFDILMDANWQLMAMLNILASICGACIMYHTEFADSGAQKMDVLPIGKGKLFLAKFFIDALMLAIMVVIEIVSLAGCARYWFLTYELDILRLPKDAGFQWMATVPTVMLMLVIASICKNMWVSLGVGVSWRGCHSCLYDVCLSTGQPDIEPLPIQHALSDICISHGKRQHTVISD